MDEAVLRSGELRIRDDLAVDFVFDLGKKHFEAQWTPRPPQRLSRKEIALYRRLRHKFLLHVADRAGGNIVVVDL